MKTPPTLFTFIDLFAGIGGFRLAFEHVGGQCAFASEWDKFSQQTYQANFGHLPAGDLTQILSENIPEHDILTGGFPCQPFSIAGITKHNALGNPHGFQHPTQGTLFFDIVRIIKGCDLACKICHDFANFFTLLLFHSIFILLSNQALKIQETKTV
jgi:DNA-cytosine methyltransferase